MRVKILDGEPRDTVLLALMWLVMLYAAWMNEGYENGRCAYLSSGRVECR